MLTLCCWTCFLYVHYFSCISFFMFMWWWFYLLSFCKIVLIVHVFLFFLIMLTLFWLQMFSLFILFRLQMFSLCLNSHGCIFCPNVFVVLVEPECFMFTLFWLYLLPFCTKGWFVFSHVERLQMMSIYRVLTKELS